MHLDKGKKNTVCDAFNVTSERMTHITERASNMSNFLNLLQPKRQIRQKEMMPTLSKHLLSPEKQYSSKLCTNFVPRQREGWKIAFDRVSAWKRQVPFFFSKSPTQEDSPFFTLAFAKLKQEAVNYVESNEKAAWKLRLFHRKTLTFSSSSKEQTASFNLEKGSFHETERKN